MRRRGRPSKFTDEQINAAVKEYLESDYIAEDVAKRHNMGKSTLLYYVTKYRENSNGIE